MKKERYVSRRITIPDLKIDFDLHALVQDKDDFDMFWNLIFSAWVKNAPKGTELRVYDYMGMIKGEKDALLGDASR